MADKQDNLPLLQEPPGILVPLIFSFILLLTTTFCFISLAHGAEETEALSNSPSQDNSLSSESVTDDSTQDHTQVSDGTELDGELLPEAVPEDEDPFFSFSDIEWSGYFKNETAFRYNEPRSIDKIRNTFSLDASYVFNSRYAMHLSSWFYYDMAYDLFNYDTIAARQKRESTQPLAFIFNLGKDRDSSGADIRELYLDVTWSDADLRIGRQFVVWGVLEGVRIVDEINPLDFRELIMPDLLDYRIPLWMAKLDYYRNEGTYEFLLIPDLRFHKPAPTGSEWELLQEVPGTLFPDSKDTSNWEYAFRLSTNFWDTDFTFSYFYTWDDFQVVFRDVLLDQTDIPPVFLSRYTRISIYGATLNKQVGDYILKGELAYVTDKYFGLAAGDVDGDGYLDFLGELPRDHIRWGLGLESSWEGMDIAASVVQWIILDYDQEFIQDKVDTSYNIFIRKPFPQSSMLFEFLAIDFVTLQERYLNPELTFFVTDRFQVSTGLDLFSGTASKFGVQATTVGAPLLFNQRSQFIGNFHDNDRAYVELKYSF